MDLYFFQAEGDSRNFMIEWLILLIYLMAMTSFATAAALQQLELG
jgi:hypothetical protein